MNMKELGIWELRAFRIGALLMLVGAAAYMFVRPLSLVFFTVGTLVFTFVQMRQVYTGNDITVIRLRRQQIVSCLMFLVAAVCMWLQEFRVHYATHNEWLVALAIGCVVQLYTAWRLPDALSKAKKS